MKFFYGVKNKCIMKDVYESCCNTNRSFRCNKNNNYYKHSSQTTYSNTSSAMKNSNTIQRGQGKMQYMFYYTVNDTLINSLGGFEGQSGGSAAPPRNNFI